MKEKIAKCLKYIADAAMMADTSATEDCEPWPRGVAAENVGEFSFALGQFRIRGTVQVIINPAAIY